MQEQILQECFALEDLQQLLKESSEQLTIIDVRSPEEYVEKHIPAAINIPLSDLEAHSKDFSKDSIIITVCGKGGGRSAQAAELLKQLGYTNANYLCGGTFGRYA
jgi:rhodanese-related sulfurtransferase